MPLKAFCPGQSVHDEDPDSQECGDVIAIAEMEGMLKESAC